MGKGGRGEDETRDRGVGKLYASWWVFFFLSLFSFSKRGGVQRALWSGLGWDI